ncbi:hypothetical protein [Xylanimonas sp. McL0601]|uniref:hypothetical protein n=1 Tax=Xylanimonas sp. McL0601 TaxID=3414739 RepID=UPI003CF6BA60
MLQMIALGALAVLLLVAAAAAPRRKLRTPFAPVALGLRIGLPVLVGSVAGLIWPAVEQALRVEPEAIAQGEVWRLVTGTVVQDGGVAGTVFNLVVLGLAILFVSKVLKTGWATGVFWGAAIVLNGIAALSGTTTAGSSGATFALLGATAGWALVRRSDLRWAAPVALVLAVVLWVTGDMHGMATILGAIVGAGLAGARRSHKLVRP